MNEFLAGLQIDYRDKKSGTGNYPFYDEERNIIGYFSADFDTQVYFTGTKEQKKKQEEEYLEKERKKYE